MPGKARTAPLSPRAWMRWPFIRQAVTDFAPSRLLEAGCGQGAMGTRLVRLTSTYVAVEPDTQSYLVARSRLEPAGARVLHGTAEALPPEEPFDTVCAFEVLEHLEDEDAALGQWRRRLVPGGQLVLSVPAFQHMYGPWDAAVGHFRRYSPEELGDVLRRNGFRPAKLDLYGWPLAFAMEKVRNVLIERRRNADPGSHSESGPSADMADRTAESGRMLQPGGLVGTATQVVVWPFTKVQKLRPSSGNGIVAVAYRQD
jgi:SAM-dependent methyltransferase